MSDLTVKGEDLTTGEISFRTLTTGSCLGREVLHYSPKRGWEVPEGVPVSEAAAAVFDVVTSMLREIKRAP